MNASADIRNKYIDQCNIDVINQSKFGTFDQLLNNEPLIREITQFCWLWPFFENCKLNGYARYENIECFCNSKIDNSLSADESISHEYFSCRYTHSAIAEERLAVLLDAQKSGKLKTALEHGLKRSAQPCEQRLALVCIVYRLRNNLFHGNKADRDMNDQLENFLHANTLLRHWLGQN